MIIVDLEQIEENTRLLAKKRAKQQASEPGQLQRHTSLDSRATKQAMLNWTQETIGPTVRLHTPVYVSSMSRVSILV